MTSGYILIAAIFVLGGLIAALGDRLGSKIGKARLRLFNLRPRQTAMIITVLTGMLISALTLGILLSLSDSLRKGIFQLDDILRELRHTKDELAQADFERQQVESQLAKVRKEQTAATEKLKEINLDFEESKSQLITISQQASQLRSELDNLLTERTKQLQQLQQLKQQSSQLQTQLQQKEQEIGDRDRTLSQKEIILQNLQQQQQVLQTEIQQRDDSILNLDQAIALKDEDLQDKTSRVANLESELKFLAREVEILEQYYQTYQELRERRIAIVKGQVLASAVVRIVDPDATISAIDRLLRQANRNVIKATLFKEEEEPEQRVVKITNAQVEQLANQIADGQDYVLRIISAGNYVQGETEVRVFADLALNKQVFPAGEEIATVSLDAENLTPSELQDRLNWLLAVCKFRAQRGGILGDIQVGDGKISTLVKFIDKISASQQPLTEMKAIASETTYTIGPLKLDLIVTHNDEIIVSTNEQRRNRE
ncbi:MAG: DUF3084 domain-containing protein [Pleurocapsa sp.]